MEERIRINENENKPLIIRKKGEGTGKVITIRIRENLIEDLERIAKESNYSRNEVINIMLQYGVENVQIR